MARIETWFDQDLNNTVKVRYIDGNLFSQDNAGNLIGVRLSRNGTPYSGGGTVSANVIRPDGTTVAVPGTLSGNAATVVLPQAAYAVLGAVSIIVKLTVNGAVTTISASIANVYQSSTDVVVDPGTIIPSIETLIAEIEAAVASIPADYSSLWATIAPAFSSSTEYTAGQYVTYNSGFYRFKRSHTGSWVSGDVVPVNVGGELTTITGLISGVGEELSEFKTEISEETRNLWEFGDTGSFVEQKNYTVNYPAGTYNFSVFAESDGTDTNESDIYLTLADETTVVLRFLRGRLSSAHCTVTSKIVNVKFYAENNYNNSVGDTASYSSIQVENGDRETKYIPHTSATDFKAREDISSTKAAFDLPNEIQSSYTFGAMDVNGDHNPSVGATFSISVSFGDRFLISGYKYNQYFPLFLFGQSGVIVGYDSAPRTNDRDYYNVPVEIGENCDTLYVNGISAEDPAVIMKYSENDVGEFVRYSAERTSNMWPYGNIYKFERQAEFNVYLPSGGYTLAADVESTDTDGSICGVVFIYTDDTQLYWGISRGTGARTTFTLEKDVKKIRLYAGGAWSTSEGDKASFCNIQITKGFAKYVYAPYVSAVDYKARAFTDVNEYWKGKKIVWFGTSIPAGVIQAGDSGRVASYPIMLGDMLQAEMYNEAVGSSCVRFGNYAYATSGDPQGFSGQWLNNFLYSLSGSSTEKQEIFNNWDYWKNIIQSGEASGVTLTDEQKQQAVNCSYDIKLNRYLTGGSVGPADLYVFDHGHNEEYRGDYNNMTIIPPEGHESDRSYFIGSMRFIIEKILTDNPRAQICFIGHYQNDIKTGISEAQIELANIWKYPLCKTWEKIGWSQNTVTINGVTKTLTEIWMPDNLHPASDTTGKAMQHYVDVLYPFMRDVR